MQAYKQAPERALAASGFERERAYMKQDIWNPGGIAHTFGHDPATYPNIDNYQHYDVIQFADAPNGGEIGDVVLQDRAPKRTSINTAYRAIQNGREGTHTREDLWDAEVEKANIERTLRGKREDLADLASTNTLEHDAGYMQAYIFKAKSTETPEVGPMAQEVAEPEAPVEPETPKGEQTEQTCEPGTLGNTLAAGAKAAAQVDKIIDPVGQE